MKTFSTWTHPATGAVRIYLSGFGNTKVWAEQCAIDQFGSDFKICAVNQNKNGSELGNIKNDAEREINLAAQKRVNTFSEVLALASK